MGMDRIQGEKTKEATVRFVKEIFVPVTVPEDFNDEQIIETAAEHYNLHEDIAVLFVSNEEAKEVTTIINVEIGLDYTIKAVDGIKSKLHYKRVTIIAPDSTEGLFIAKVHGVKGFEKVSLQVSELEPIK